MSRFLDAIVDLWTQSGLAQLLNFQNGGWKNLIMIAVACLLLYLAIKKKFEPLLLLPIAFGMLLVNLPLGGISTQDTIRQTCPLKIMPGSRVSQLSRFGIR